MNNLLSWVATSAELGAITTVGLGAVAENPGVGFCETTGEGFLKIWDTLDECVLRNGENHLIISYNQSDGISSPTLEFSSVAPILIRNVLQHIVSSKPFRSG